ncbi:chitin disaccharide deacetylase [Yokenella regensburgei]|uniref:chitin disaccharide deacetylase n=1 Tax=Yokenella regensburgei TaxID=158877 RepID=UPI003F182728
MSNLLIVNADDFGLSRGQNYGIIEACRHGVVLSTTALVNGAAIEHAVELRRLVPELGVGLHFNLTLGKPLGVLPSLTRDGVLGKWLWEQAERGALALDEIAEELERQYGRFLALFGGPPSHIDSHHHVHMMSDLFPLVADFAKAKDVPIRIDREVVQRHALRVDGLRSTDGYSSGFYGESITASLFTALLDESLLRKDNSFEMMCHPAFVDKGVLASHYCYPRLDELELLTQPALKRAIAGRGFRPGNFRSL